MIRKQSAAPGFVVGVALAGLFDGVVLRQILQWRQRQDVYDGLFQAAMLALLGTGMWLLIGQMRRGAAMTQQRFWSAALFGGGVFTVLEAIVEFHVGLLFLGAAMAAAGLWLYRQQTGIKGFKPPAYQFIRNTLEPGIAAKENGPIRSVIAQRGRLPQPATGQSRRVVLETRGRTEASLDLFADAPRAAHLGEKLWEPEPELA